MKTLKVGLEQNSYDIVIEPGLLSKLGALIQPFIENSGSVAVVTDENVWRCHGGAFDAAMRAGGIGYRPVVVPPGEAGKSLQGLSGVYDAFADMALQRGGLVVAFGGGVVGDLCGFACATWMRGVRFVQVPTSLLAHVDSSVGGKTGINLPYGKNIVGAFYQPKFVVIDPETLTTLPEREVRCGMAEIIKYAAIRSKDLFELLQERPDNRVLSQIIYDCCAIKADIVARDERDLGERMLLNFGHTFGHAIEKKYNFERYNHGEAVAVGMVIAARVGEELGYTAPGTAQKMRSLLILHGLEAEYKDGRISDLTGLIAADKKSVGDGVHMVFLRDIGESFIQYIDFAALKSAVERMGRQQ